MSNPQGGEATIGNNSVGQICCLHCSGTVACPLSTCPCRGLSFEGWIQKFKAHQKLALARFEPPKIPNLDHATQERALQLDGKWAAGGRLRISPHVTPRHGGPRTLHGDPAAKHRDFERSWLAGGPGPGASLPLPQ